MKIITKIFKKGFKYPEGYKAIFYINSKIDINQLKKLYVNQLNISLTSLRNLGSKLNDLIGKINSITNFDNNIFDSFKSLVSDFSGSILFDIQNYLSETLINIRNTLFSLLKNLILGKTKNDSNLIFSWSDYFIKGIKICSNISEAESLSELLVQNGIISMNGELKEDNFLETRELKKIENKIFPIKLNLNLKSNYKKVKSKVENILTKIDPQEKINTLMYKFENDIELIRKKEIKIISQDCSKLIENCTMIILKKEKECKNSLKDYMNAQIENSIKDLIDASNKIKNIIRENSNCISEDINALINSIKDKIDNIEFNINTKFEEQMRLNIQKLFGANELINKIKEKLKLNNIKDIINKVPEQLLNEIDILSQALREKEVSEIIQGLDDKILNLFNSFKIRYNNDIKPTIEFINKIKINLDEIQVSSFLSKKKQIQVNSLPIIKEIKEQLDMIKINVNNKKDEILNNIDNLIGFMYNFYESILQKEAEVLDILFKPCDNFLVNLLKISEDIQSNINNVIYPIISSIIKDYLDKIRNFSLNIINRIKNTL